MKQQTKNKQLEWKEVALGGLGDISAGGTPSRNNPKYWKGKIPWLKISNLKDFYVTKYDETITKEGLENSSAKLFSEGTILISIFASLGEVAILNIKAATNQAIAGIYNLDNNLNKKYLALYLKSLKEHFRNIGRGVAQSNLNLSILKKTKIKLPFSNGSPDLQEQERIVSLLERAERQMEKSKKTEELLDEYLKSIFNEMFYGKGFEIKKLNDLCDVRDGTHESPKYKNEGYPLITSKNLAKGFIDFSEVNLISQEDFDKVNRRSKVNKGDIIMPMIGTIGHPIIVPKTREFAIKNVSLIKFTKTNISNVYVKHLLDSDYFKELIFNVNRGGTQKFIALKDIRNFKIPRPPIGLQQKFAQIVEHVEKIKEHVRKTKLNAEELFDSFMNKAFKGKL